MPAPSDEVQQDEVTKVDTAATVTSNVQSTESTPLLLETLPPLLPDVLRESRRRFASNPCLGRRLVGEHEGLAGAYHFVDYDTIMQRAADFGAGLFHASREVIASMAPDDERRFGCNLNYRPNIGIMSENRTEWVLADLACLKYGLVSVPLQTAGSFSIGRVMEL